MPAQVPQVTETPVAVVVPHLAAAPKDIDVPVLQAAPPVQYVQEQIKVRAVLPAGWPAPCSAGCAGTRCVHMSR